MPPLRALGAGLRDRVPQRAADRGHVLRGVRPARPRLQRGLPEDPGAGRVFTRLGIDLPYFRFALIALALYTGAFVCEALRAGVNAVGPAGRGGPGARASPSARTCARRAAAGVRRPRWCRSVSVIIAMIKNSALAGFFGLVGDLSATADLLTAAEGSP